MRQTTENQQLIILILPVDGRENANYKHGGGKAGALKSSLLNVRCIAIYTRTNTHCDGNTPPQRRPSYFCSTCNLSPSSSTAKVIMYSTLHNSGYSGKKKHCNFAGNIKTHPWKLSSYSCSIPEVHTPMCDCS